MVVNKIQMETSKRKRGISLSHHTTTKQEPFSFQMEESRVKQVMRPYTGTNTPKQPRFSSAPKPKIIFSYAAQQGSNRQSINMLNSDKSYSAYSQNSSARQQVAYAPFMTPNSTPKQFESAQRPTGFIPCRLFTNAKKDQREQVSTQTERKNYFINNQFGISQRQQDIKAAFEREEYQKLMENRRKHLGISNKVVSYKQDANNQQKFSKIQLPKQNHIPQKVTGKKGQNKSTAQDLQSLQDMEKRLREIINICDNRLS